MRFHVGTAEIMGTVSLLDCDTIEPGQWGLAQLFLEEPATATWGQPFVVRESSATQTLGGGQVLQPVARKIRRRHLEMLERIETLWTGDARRAGPDGGLVRRLRRLHAGRPGARRQRRPRRGRRADRSGSRQQGELVEVAIGPARQLLLHARHGQRAGRAHPARRWTGCTSSSR